MRKLLLFSALLIFACSSDDSNDNGNDNSNQTFLEKYDGIIWEDITFDTSEGFRRYAWTTMIFKALANGEMNSQCIKKPH